MNVYSPYIPVSWLLPILGQISTGREKVHANHKLYRLYCAFTSLSFPGEAAPSSQQTWEGWRAIWSPRVDKFDRFDCDCSEWKCLFLLCLHPAFTDMKKLELTGGAWSSSSFRWSKCYLSFKRYLAAKICFLKSITFHPVVLIRLPCVLRPPQLRAATLEGASARRTRRGGAATRSTILVKRKLRQFAWDCYLWMQRVSRCALTVRCKNGNPGIDVSWVPPCEVFQSQ